MNSVASVDILRLLTMLSVFPTELRDGRDGVGAVHSHSAAGEFIH